MIIEESRFGRSFYAILPNENGGPPESYRTTRIIVPIASNVKVSLVDPSASQCIAFREALPESDLILCCFMF